MKTIKILFFLYSFIFLQFSLLGQSAEQIIHSIKQAYSESSSLAYSASVHYFPNLLATQANDSTLIEIKQIGDLYIMTMEEVEIVRAQDLNLYIDHSEKLIYVLKDQTESKDLGIDKLQIMARQMGLTNLSVEQINDEKAMLRFSNPHDQYSKIELVFDKCDYFLMQSIIAIDSSINYDTEFKDKRIETTYSSHSTRIAKSEISSKDYVELKNSKLIPVKAYSDYELTIQ